MVSAIFAASRLRLGGRLKSFSRYSHSKALHSTWNQDTQHFHPQPRNVTMVPTQTPLPSYPTQDTAYPDVDNDIQQNEILHTAMDEVIMIQDKADAADMVDLLMSLPKDMRVAWDTETADIDASEVSPVGNGRVICATAYAMNLQGENLKVFVDCLNDDGSQSEEMLNAFKGYFENEMRKKVWHNYGFDRHMLTNHGIYPKGFAGDTMHMGRLVDSSRKSYSLEALCDIYLQSSYQKYSMSKLFGDHEKLKDGSAGKRVIVPYTVDLQTGNDTRDLWIAYSIRDAELTHRLYTELAERLKRMEIGCDESPHSFIGGYENMLELYEDLMVPFGSLLADIEDTGFRVDVEWLRKAAEQAEQDRRQLEDRFRHWAGSVTPDARYMNIHSGLQKQTFFFAPFVNRKKKSKKGPEGQSAEEKDYFLPQKKSFQVKPEEYLSEKYVQEIRAHIAEESEVLGTCPKKDGTDPSKREGKPKKLKKDLVLVGQGLKPCGLTVSGWPSVSAESMDAVASKLVQTNTKEPISPEKLRMKEAIDNLNEASKISTLISSFLQPLQDWPGRDNRIHPSLNLNTETGRLSSRRPNLQNQPALDKDRYKIRKSFVPEEGNSLIVADYGQLELRLLAHISNCQSMIDAFEAGGDFHSRTAMGMFKEVREAIQRGECVLERKEGLDIAGNPPLLKDVYASHRRKAKVLNFSIAYGKTAKGLSNDWNCSEQEARDTLKLWYADRPEVLEWQQRCREFLREYGYVETVLGRRRVLPNVHSEDVRSRYQAERAAINAPIQGSAADLVMAAMTRLDRNRVISGLGWKTILQVHDEIILEGPEESADYVLPIVIDQMKNPLGSPLRVDLTVDARCAKSWYDAK